MPRVAVTHCFRTLEASIRDAVDAVDDAGNFYRRKLDGTFERIGVRRVEVVACIALLQMHLAWEDFLEHVFARYLCGAETTNGFRPTLLQPIFGSTQLALEHILAGRDYAMWNVDDVKRRAPQYFKSGAPFDVPTRAAETDLKDVAVVRNRIAHRSISAGDKFRAVVRKKLGSVPRGMTPGRFLLTRGPSVPNGDRFIDYYASIFVALGKTVVP